MVVQGALKLILEPIFEADFQPGLLSSVCLPGVLIHEAAAHIVAAVPLEPTARVVGMNRAVLAPY
jgi:hypothetical protein